MKNSFLYNNEYKTRSRKLRKKETDAEKVLWSRLRARRFLRLKFRRQHPVDFYILDFYCRDKALAIELDGSHHMKKKQKQLDLKRDYALKLLGITTLRFFDNEVFQNLEGVLETIAASVKPHPNPLLQGEGE